MKKYLLILFLLLNTAVFAKKDNRDVEHKNDTVIVKNDSLVDDDNTHFESSIISFRLGGYISNVNSYFGFKKADGAVGVLVNTEELLNLETRNSVWRGSIASRIKKRHYVLFDVFSLNRNASTFLGRDLIIGGDTLKIGENVSTEYDLTFLKLSYTFSFYQSKMVDIGVGVGLHILSTGLKITTEKNEYGGNGNFNLPLPVLTTRLIFAPRKWFKMSSTFNYLYVSFDNFKGSLVENTFAFEFPIWKYLGIGTSFSQFNFRGGALVDKFYGSMAMDFDGVSFYLISHF